MLQIPLGLLLVFAIIVLPSALATRDTDEVVPEKVNGELIDLESAADEIILLEKVVPESILLHPSCMLFTELVACQLVLCCWSKCRAIQALCCRN